MQKNLQLDKPQLQPQKSEGAASASVMKFAVAMHQKNKAKKQTH